MVNAKIAKLDPNALIPAAATAGAAGLDLTSIEKVEFEPDDYVLVSTGVAVQRPEGYCGFVLPRSGLALKKGLTVLNAPGLIDSDYRGEIRVLLCNASTKRQQVSAGDRIAQLVVMQVQAVRFAVTGALDPTDRGDGGFGSTG